MKKALLLFFVAATIVIGLATCEKSSQPVSSNEDQPITVSLEIDGKQSQEVRIK
jgi:hypothetical protein